MVWLHPGSLPVHVWLEPVDGAAASQYVNNDSEKYLEKSTTSKGRIKKSGQLLFSEKIKA